MSVGGAHPLHPPPRSAPENNVTWLSDISIIIISSSSSSSSSSIISFSSRSYFTNLLQYCKLN